MKNLYITILQNTVFSYSLKKIQCFFLFYIYIKFKIKYQNKNIDIVNKILNTEKKLVKISFIKNKINKY